MQKMVLMRKIVLISCGKKKLSCDAKAEDMYTSPLFQLTLKYAKTLNADDIYILSAKHGLLPLDTIISPYNMSLAKMSVAHNKHWSRIVLNQLRKVCDLDHTEFVFLAGKDYRRCLIPEMKYVTIPLEGLGIGEQLHTLKTRGA